MEVMRAWRSDGRGDLWLSGQVDDLAGSVADNAQTGDSQVLVEMESATISTLDMNLIRRAPTEQVRPPFTPGLAIAGKVLHGEGFRRGIRVVGSAALGHGAWAERALADKTRLLTVPDGVSSSEALALFVPGQTAGLAVWQRARLAPGETAVLHDPLSSVGAISLQLAASSGVKVITVGEASWEHRLVELGAHDFVDVEDGGWPDYVRKQYGYVDAVLDLAGSAPIEQSANLLGFEGRLVVGRNRGADESIDTTNLAKRCGNVLGVSWSAYERFRPDVLKTISTRLFELLRRAAINPAIDRHVAFDEIGDTVKRVSGGVDRTILVDAPEPGAQRH